MRLFKGLLGLVVLMLLATGCFRFDGKIVVQDDGSGSIDLLSALNAEVVTSALGDFGDLGGEDIGADLGSREELCSDFSTDFSDTEGLPAGAQITPYDEDGFCGSRLSLALPAGTNHDALVTQVFDSPTQLYKEGENWIFSTDFDADELTADTADAPPFLLDTLFEGASFAISVQLPGRPVEGQNNATSVDGNTFKWEIDIFEAPPRLFAQTEPGSASSSGGTNWVLIALVVVGLAVAAALVWLLLNKRKSAPAMPPGARPLGGPSAGTSAPPPLAAPQSAPAPTGADSRSTVVINPSAVADAFGRPEPVASEPFASAPVASEPVASEPMAAEPAPAPAAPVPVYDEALGAWIVDDPVRGRLKHDPATDTWGPAQ